MTWSAYTECKGEATRGPCASGTIFTQIVIHDDCKPGPWIFHYWASKAAKFLILGLWFMGKGKTRPSRRLLSRHLVYVLSLL